MILNRIININNPKLFLLWLILAIPTMSFSQVRDIEYTTSNNVQGMAHIMEFSTLGYESGLYTVRIGVTGSSSRYAARLMYRVDSTEWKDAKDSRGKAIECSNYGRRRTATYKIILEDEVLDKERVEYGWKIKRYKGGGRIPRFSFSGIKLAGEYDPYKGVPTELMLYAKQSDEYKSFTDNSLSFNHIPYPYTFSQTKRLWIRAKYLREDVRLRLSGSGAEHFTIDTRNFFIDSLEEKIISISYTPKNIGRHYAQLILSTEKLPSNIALNLSGSCDSMRELGHNFIEKPTHILMNKDEFQIPVFSQKNYQLKFNYKAKALGDSELYIIYKWYKDSDLLFESKDNIYSCEKSKRYIRYDKEPEIREYCMPLYSPKHSNRLEIEISSKLYSGLEIADLYFGSPTPKRLIESGDWSDAEIWEPKGVPSLEDFVFVPSYHKLRVDRDSYCSTLILGDSAIVEVEPNTMFYVSDDIIYGKKSWFIVHQDLPGEKWVYTSSPVSETKALIYSMRKDNNETWLMEYNTGIKSKHNDYWSDYIVDPNHIIIPGKGYSVLSKQKLDLIYEGKLNDSEVHFPLVYTNEDSWNLVGNPYTAPLSSKKLLEDIDGKIQGNVIFLFDANNETYNPIIIDSKEEVAIPSLHGFFVEAIKQNSEMIFKRSQQYVPQTSLCAWNNHNYLTLNISNRDRTGYVIMGMVEDASYGFDKYDAHKLFGSSKETPELYFIIDNEEFAVNVFPDYPVHYSLGVYSGIDSELDLSLGNLSVLPENVHGFVYDKYLNKYSSLCDKYYRFSTKQGSVDDRFEIILLKGFSIPELDHQPSGVYHWTDNKGLKVYSDSYHDFQALRFWDRENRLIYSQDLKKGLNIIDFNFEKGIYSVSLELDNNEVKGFVFEIK